MASTCAERIDRGCIATPGHRFLQPGGGCVGTVLAAHPTVNEPPGCAVSDTPTVRITGIRLDRLVMPLDPAFPAAWDPVPRRSFAATIVRVETDEGVVGIGSGDSMDGFEAYQHLFVGGDPLAIARHVRTLETIDFHAGRYWPLEVALWDIVGQVAGLPVATLFGGASEGIPAYASCGMLLAPAARAESALRLRDEGFGALKIRVDPNRLEEGMAAVAATRDAVGDSMAIMVDLNQGWRMAGDTSPLARPGRRPRDRRPAGRRRRRVGRGAAGRHRPAPAWPRSGRRRRASGSPAGR